MRKTQPGIGRKPRHARRRLLARIAAKPMRPACPLDACTIPVFVIERSAGRGCWTRASKLFEDEREALIAIAQPRRDARERGLLVDPYRLTRLRCARSLNTSQ